MKPDKSFSIVDRLRSFQHAWRGFRDILKTEHNAWVHSFFTVMAIGFSFWLEIGPVKFCFIILSIVSVWAAEAFNTVYEILVDFMSPDYSAAAKRAKDIAAAGVMFASTGAVIIGLVIFGPPLAQKLSELF